MSPALLQAVGIGNEHDPGRPALVQRVDDALLTRVPFRVRYVREMG